MILTLVAAVDDPGAFALVEGIGDDGLALLRWFTPDGEPVTGYASSEEVRLVGHVEVDVPVAESDHLDVLAAAYRVESVVTGGL